MSVHIPRLEQYSSITNIPYHVLVDVMRYAYHLDGGPNAVSKFSRTCKYFHFEGVKVLLGEKVVFHIEKHLASFCTFMLADRKRFSMLRGRLVICVGSISGPTTALLIDCLRYITDLPSLHLMSATTFLRSQPLLIAAFAGLTCLTDLYLLVEDQGINSPKAAAAGPAHHYAILLRTMRSPLRSVRLNIVVANILKRFTYMRSLDPVWLLSPHSKTLQSICMENHFTTDASTTVHIFPYVTSLTLSDMHRIQHIRPFIASFPTLRSLRFCGQAWRARIRPHESLKLSAARPSSRLPLTSRLQNKHDQATFGTWTMLEEVVGPTLELYKMGLICRIPRVHIVLLGGVPADEVTMVQEIVQDACPTTVRVMMKMEDIIRVLEPTFLPPHAVLYLTCLELKLNMDALPFCPKDYFERVVRATELLPLVSLTLEIRCEMSPRFYPEDDGCVPPRFASSEWPSFCRTLDKMEEEDVPGHLRDIATRISTLRRVTIAWGRCLAQVPHRVVTLDLDRVPQIIDRPENPREDSEWWHDAF
ncbi:hypothetical protein OH76DRAFT_1029466 [Lentinus brumalis]|uniref:F-box domain-containing protein n=1 Tax=Lentinus brumalis TaxID=2498619 RepID=A0A371CXB4_9APHY|nr:hypothetical protein OH76DRAFT_1029466 [Polyporus brumalis]